MAKSIAGLLLVVGTVAWPTASAAMVCLDGAGVTVVRDDQSKSDPDEYCVPQGAGQTADEVFADADVSPPSGWTLWSSRGDGQWKRESVAPKLVTTSDGGFIAWSSSTEPPRTDPSPLTEVEAFEATRPPGQGGAESGEALPDVLKLVGFIGALIAGLVIAVVVMQRRQSDS